MIFKIDVFFVLLKEEMPNKSDSEILESLIIHLKKLGNEGGNEQWFQCPCHSNKLDLSNLENHFWICGFLDDLT